MKRAWVVCLLLTAASGFAAPLRLVDLTGSPDLFPLEDAFGDLAGRASVTVPGAGETPDLGNTDVLIVDGNTDPAKRGVAAGAVETFVRNGGGLLIAGLPRTLGRTAELWSRLGEAAPANVVAADLFPDDSGYWMWIGPQGRETPDHIRYIRKAITITKPVRRAYIRATVDNLYWVFLNGEQVGYHWSWFDYELWDISKRLRQGKNVVAFKGRNVDGPGGFFAQIGIEYEDGTRELIAGDKTWKFHIPEEEGWASIDFDDSAWGPAKSISPMAGRTPLPDRGTDVEGKLSLDHSHPIFNAIADRFGATQAVRDIEPKTGAQVLASIGDQPVIVSRTLGKGRVILLNAVDSPGGIGSGDMADDLLTTCLLWLGNRPEPVTFATAEYLPPVVTIDGKPRPYVRLGGDQPEGIVAALEALVQYADGRAPRPGSVTAGPRPGAADNLWQGWIALENSQDEGSLAFQATMRDAEGNVIFHRDWQTEVKNPVNIALSVPSNRFVTAEGLQIDFTGAYEGTFPEGSRIDAWIEDASGTRVSRLEPTQEAEEFQWHYVVPNLAEGRYRLKTQVTGTDDKIVDESALDFYVVPRLDLRDFYSTTMRLSPFSTFDQRGIEREIDDIIAHGFNTLTFSGHRLGAGPNPILDYAEDYAQREGMAVSYSFQGDFSILGRNGVPDVSVYSPQYREALQLRINQAVTTCKRVPRLLNVQGYMDEPFQVGGKTLDDRPPARAEFKRRYGIEMPTREEAMKDPALWLKYVDFWSDCFAVGWQQSYEMVKALHPDFWVELTHDSHNTFGAAGNDFKGRWAVDDVYHWGAPFDSVNYDIYPYLSVDFRRGKFRDPAVPRIAGMHMAFAEMRNLAYTYDKKLGFWVESGWGGKLATDSGLNQYTWSPRELTYTSIAAGCDYLNTFWGIPQDARWWKTHGETMNEVKSIAPLLTRSTVPRAKAAFLFPRTQHVLLQEEYWNVMVGLEAFRRAYGELDCIHEDQLAEGTLDQYKILVLFDIHLMKRASAETIRDWCERGGVILADEVPALDELKQPLHVFEPVFGVQGNAEVRQGPFEILGGRVAGALHRLWGLRGYTADEVSAGTETAGDAPVWFERQFGQGRAHLLNFPVKDCYFHALADGNPNEDATNIVRLVGAGAINRSEANVFSSNPQIEAAVRQTAQGTTLLFVINHESKDPATRVRVPCASPGGTMRDLVTGERIAYEGQCEVALDCPWGTTRLIGIFPSDPQRVSIAGLPESAKPGEALEYAAEVGGDDVRGNYLLDISVVGPDGATPSAFSGRTCTVDGRCERTIRLPINAQPGKWTVEVESLWDGSRAEATFEVVATSQEGAQ